ncbi:tyrosine phosphatase-like protein [Dactylonectria estremocensis]|uniref:Very-long-chain (3R)-3-hydroxyacyl-CoA dehydratase n=1 Tax=Dactylonectria estremocensis TaxID=1079267 RepID=A0A9P9JIB6_9HYPO|nr:tyrosine phosphatase-like protein [Dactylonectria estremocensis]
MASSAPAAVPKPKRQASTLNKSYLVLYNVASAAAWSVVLGRTVSLLGQQGPQAVYPGVGEWTKWTQTAAAMEILHSLFGVVRAPLLTTLAQVASRLLLVWPIVDVFPYLALQPWYSSMLIAWSVTEVIRYSFFALSISGFQPWFLTWLRYSTFYVLYPIGITSECNLIWRAIEPARQLDRAYPWAIYGILLIYVPGTCSFILFTHMMSQRRKTMRNHKAQSGKSQ